MSLRSALDAVRTTGKKGLAVFFTAGDQPLDQIHDLISAIVDGGADLIEVGIPFSDPYGEGPTIQASSYRSLHAGTTTQKIFDALSQRPIAVPAIAMGYTNQALQMGFDAYAQHLAASGLQGAILSDLVPDEAKTWCEAAEAHGVETVFLAAPTSTESRIQEVTERSTGFIYAVTRTGVTGAENAVPPQAGELVKRIRRQTEKPIYAGFGISTAEQVSQVCAFADGAIVGSRVVQFVHECWQNGKGATAITSEIKRLKSGTL